MARRKTWHREDIKAALRKRYGTMSRLSAEWGYNANAITHALISPSIQKPIARRIARALDLHPSVLWPDVFSRNDRGDPDSGGEPDITAPISPTESQKRRAA